MGGNRFRADSNTAAGFALFTCEVRLVRRIQSNTGSIDPGAWLPRGVYFCYQREVRFLHGLIDSVALIGNHKVDVPRGIGKCLLPEALCVRWFLPRPVIPFIDDLPQ